jgi:hypothetical protein
MSSTSFDRLCWARPAVLIQMLILLTLNLAVEHSMAFISSVNKRSSQIIQPTPLDFNVRGRP